MATAATGPRSAETLSRITDLFVRDAERFTDDHIAVFDEVIGLLADRIELYARAALAERLADVPRAPPRVISRLARDDIAVARPVLERSPRLTENDLVDLALTFGQGHLLAISARPHLPEAVTDILIERGDRVVLHATVRNATARISARGFGGLLARAHNDEDLQELLGTRADLPPERLQELVLVARAEVRERLLAAMRDRSAEFVEQALEAGAQRVSAEIEAAATDADGYSGEALERHRAGTLCETDIGTFASDGRKSEASAGLGLLAGLPRKIADRIFTEPQEDLLLIVCKSLDFRWPTVQVLVALKSGAPARASLYGKLESNYDTLSRLTAQRVLRFLKAREDTAEDV
jgi:uncharacterized protein (DUF2336 family)